MVFAGQDAWRKHPMLTGCYKRPFPGFGYAVAIFAGYCVVDGAVNYLTAPKPRTYPTGTFKFEAMKDDDDDDDE
ncbi:unnamed protein product [Laminaria digitata]